MPITVPCPHCRKKWKLRDDFAGKRIKCPNPECGQAFAVPAAGAAPSANGTHGPELIAKPVAPRPAAKAPPPPPPVTHDAEKLAADLLHELDKPAAPVEEQTFEYACHFCDHKWMLPVSQRGKNVLCPECKQRQKIPEKKVAKIDWRDPNAERPTLARGPELPEDLKQQQTKNVAIESLVEAGAIPEAEVEPLPLRTKLTRVALAVAGVGLIAFAVVYFLRSRTDDRDNKLYLAAVESIKGVTDDGLPKGQAPLVRAALNTAAGEAAIRLNDKTKVKDALGRYSEARRELEDAPPSVERDYLLGDLALAVLSLGGTPEQVAGELRLPWRPGIQKGSNPQFGGPGNDVQAEVRRVLVALNKEGKAADREHRLAVVRRLARALIAKNQLELLNEILSQGFAEGEMLEAKAHTYFERIRAGAPVGSLAQPGEDFAPSLEVQYQDLAGEKALEKAKRSASPESRVVALALVAEFAPNPKEAVAVAAEIVERDKSLPMKGVLPLALVRLNHAAGKAGDKGFAEAIADPAVQALAEAEAVRGRIAANASVKIEIATLTKAGAQPTVGQVSAALAGCRHNARVSRDKAAAKEYETWPAANVKPAGLLGLVLGLQDAMEK